MRLGLILGTVASVAFAGFAAPAAAQNLVANPHFDGGVFGGWTHGAFGTTSWSSVQDHHGAGSVAIGSALSSPPGGGSATLYQCLPVTASTSYGFGLWTYQDSGQTDTGYGGATASWYASIDCTGGSLRTDSTLNSSVANSWELLFSTVTSPGTAQSALLVIFGFKSSLTGSYQVYLDDGFLGQGLTPLELTRFWAE